MSFAARFLLVLFAVTAFVFALRGQVGIGTLDPARLLSVNGSILVDQSNTNFGTLDSAALLFGTTTGVGLSSNRTPGGTNLDGLDIWTDNQRRVQVTSSGMVGINLNTGVAPQFPLDVFGNIRSSFNIHADNYLSGNHLQVYQNSTVNGKSYVGEQMGIGTSPTATYRLRVNGDTRINEDLVVDGTTSVTGKVTAQGKAIMLSNSGTTLRSGFNSGTFTYNNIAPGAYVDITFIVTPFIGSNANIRVMISQFQPGSGASNWGSVVMTPHSVDDINPQHSNQSTCTVRFTNTGSSAASLGTNAVLYLYSVVTH